jgi:hypothetical protein
MIARWVEYFEVVDLNWRRLDLDISSLVEAAKRRSLRLRNLSLYTIGHKGVIFHWTSKLGVVAIPHVSKYPIFSSVHVKCGVRVRAETTQLENVYIHLTQASVGQLIWRTRNCCLINEYAMDRRMSTTPRLLKIFKTIINFPATASKIRQSCWLFPLPFAVEEYSTTYDSQT